MKPGDPIVIERAANGWMVRPEWPRDSVVNVSDIRVFQHIDYDQQGVMCSDYTLFQFLLQHFAPSPDDTEGK